MAGHSNETAVVAGLLVVCAQLGWAFVIPLVVAATDGIPADEYSASNRGAIGFLIIFLAIVLPIGAGVVYTIAHALRIRLPVAVGLAQLPALVALVLIVTNV